MEGIPAQKIEEGFQAVREMNISFDPKNNLEGETFEAQEIWKGKVGQRDGRMYLLDEEGKPMGDGFQAFHGKMLGFPGFPDVKRKAVMVGQVDGKQYFIDQKTGKKLHEQGYQSIRFDESLGVTIGQLDGRKIRILDPDTGIPEA